MRFFFLVALQVYALLMLPVLTVSATSGTEIAGVVPRTLSAIDDNNAKCYESSLGSAAADAVRITLGSDVAVIPGGDLAVGLVPGQATYDDIKNVFAHDRGIATVRVTIKELRQTLENGLAHLALDKSEKIDVRRSAFDGFPQISGFKLSYDVSMPPGQRIYEILIHGASVDLDSDTQTLTLGSTAYMMEGGYGLPPVADVTVSELTLSDALLRYIVSGMKEYSPSEHRMHMRGGYDAGLSEYVPLTIFPIITVIFFVAYLTRSRREKDMTARSEIFWY